MKPQTQEFIKISLLILIAITIISCGTGKIRQGEPGLPNFEMISKDTRVERFGNSKLLRGVGKVKAICDGKPCSSSEVRDMGIMKIQKFPRHGEWDHYRQVTKPGTQDQFENYLYERGMYEDDKKVGTWIDFHRGTEKKAGETPYKKGERHGKVIGYNIDGKKILELTRQFDKREGVAYRFNPDSGSVIGETNYRDDKRSGPHFLKTKTASGVFTMHEIGNYRDDKKVGEWKYYRPEDGSLARIVNYENDLRHGKVTFFHKDGKTVMMEGLYQRGYRVGEWKIFYDNGNLNAEGGYSPRKSVSGSQKIEKRGGKMMILRDVRLCSTDGKFKIEKKWFPYLGNEKPTKDEGPSDPDDEDLGLPVEEGEKKKEKISYARSGIWKEYYKDGKLFGTGPRENGRTGVWKFYDKEGQVRFDGFMRNEVMMECGTVYDDKGNVKGSGKFLFSIITIDDKTDRFKSSYKTSIPFTTFHPNGNKKMEAFSQERAVEYDVNGQKIGTGPFQNGQKNGCWKEGGRTVYYMMGRPNDRMKSTCN